MYVFHSVLPYPIKRLFVQRDKKRRSYAVWVGLKKIVLVQDPSYIDDSPAIMDSDEYSMVIRNIGRIARESAAYIETYVKHVSGSEILHPREFARKYGFSTLPYFHDILGLPEDGSIA